MSERYRFTIEFNLRADAPAALITALQMMHDTMIPAEDTVANLPGLARAYLRPGGYSGDGVPIFQTLGPIQRYRDGVLTEVPFEPHEGAHHLKLIRTFHDDEYGNGGLYFPYWLFQFAADDGMIAMETGNAYGLPKIIVKQGDQLIETQLAYHPAEFWPATGQSVPDADAPIATHEPHVINLCSMLAALDDAKDDFWC